MPRRVVVFGEYGTLNGGENSLLAVVPALVQRGWDLTLAAPAHSAFSDAIQRHGVANIDWSTSDQSGRRLSQDLIRQSIRQILETTMPDVVHCNSLSTSRLVGPVTSSLNIPAIGFLRDILGLSRTATNDINRLDQIAAVSKATRDFHVTRGLDPEKCVVIYNGIDTKSFSPDVPPASLDEFGIQESDRVLLYVGQIGMRKGIDVLLRVFELVQSQIQKVHLLIAGVRHSQKQEAVDYETKAIQFSRSLSTAQSGVHWLGRRSDICALMNRADLLVHPARQEPLGRVLLESLACGLPLVATNVGGTVEIIDCPEMVDLLLAPADDVNGLTQKIVHLLQDKAKCNELGQQFQQIAFDRFSIDRCANQLDFYYHNLLK